MSIRSLRAPERSGETRGRFRLRFLRSTARRSTLAHQNIFRSRDGGETWQIVSPDLSRPNEGTPSNLDPATLADTNNVARHGVVYAIAPSPLRADLVWAGTDDGYIWVTRDNARSWQNVTPPALTSWSKVGIIEASHFDAGTAYAAIDRHRLDDYRPYIYRTRDFGATWTAIANGIPDGSFVNAVREDPVRRGLLYAGTERGVYVSFDDGAFWQPLQLNLPVTSIRDIAVHGDDIVIATHGRAFWVMDDIAPLRQLRNAAASGGTYLFAAATAYRVRPTNQEGTPLPLDEPQVDNAKVGLYIDYYLPDVPRTPVVIDILASDGSRSAPLVERAATQTGRSQIGRLHDALDCIGSRPRCAGRSAPFCVGLSPRHARRTARSARGVHGAPDRQRQRVHARRESIARSPHCRERC